jgi:hypothetical protein
LKEEGAPDVEHGVDVVQHETLFVVVEVLSGLRSGTDVMILKVFLQKLDHNDFYESSQFFHQK